MGTDYSGRIAKNETGLPSVTVSNADVANLRRLLNAGRLTHVANEDAAGSLTVLDFGSEVDIDELRAILKRYAELA